jgi:response regulator RpfG family c-di-GMP phosphodiesterase
MALSKILICDDEEDILEILSFCVADQIQSEIFHAKNGNEAINILNNSSVDLLICDYNMPIKNGGDVYQHIINRNMPVRYVLCSTDNRSDHLEFKDQSAFFGWIQKPNIIQGAMEILQKFQLEALVDPPSNVHQYTSIGLHFLLRLSLMPADIFIKISDNKYVKVFSQGDIFDETDFVKHHQKGVNALFAFNANSKTIINSMNDRIKKLKSSGRDSINIQFEVNDLIRLAFQSYGLHSEIVEETQFLIQDTLSLYKKEKDFTLLMNKMLSLKDHYIGKHSFLLSGVACFIAKHMSWISDLTQNKLVTTALMHDLFLIEQDLMINGVEHRESEILHKKAAGDNFMTHPARSAELIARIPNIPPDCSSIILEQHEVGDGLGIPHQLNWSKISPLGQLFSFSHFVVDEMLRLQVEAKLNQVTLIDALKKYESKTSNYKKFFEVLSQHSLFEQKL